MKLLVLFGYWLISVQTQITCRGFFSIWLPDCIDNLEILSERLAVMNAVMQGMDSIFTLYTPSLRGCDFSYSNIRIASYNATQLLISYGFSSVLSTIVQWRLDHEVNARISDIIRLILSHKYQLSYLDTDVHFLSFSKDIFLVPYAAMGVYGDRKASLEITNSAYCLPRQILAEMLSLQLLRIANGSSTFFYTELGPAIFQKIILNNQLPVRLYSQNHPGKVSVFAIADDIDTYGHIMVHITGHIRRAHREGDNNKGGRPIRAFIAVINSIREVCGLPALNISNDRALHLHTLRKRHTYLHLIKHSLSSVQGVVVGEGAPPPTHTV